MSHLKIGQHEAHSRLDHPEAPCCGQHESLESSRGTRLRPARVPGFSLRHPVTAVLPNAHAMCPAGGTQQAAAGSGVPQSPFCVGKLNLPVRVAGWNAYHERAGLSYSGDNYSLRCTAAGLSRGHCLEILYSN